MKTIIDTHAHVLNESYKEDLHNVIKQMQENNTIAYNISYDLKSSKETLLLNEQYDFLIPVIGIHPNDTKGWNQSMLDELESLISDKVAAIGEIGLDYHYEGYDKEEQAKAFVQQIELAGKYNLPIVVHTRDSLEDCYEIVKNYPNQKFLFHSWSGDKELTKKYLDISENVYFSYNGIITFKNAQLQQEIIKEIPLDKLMFETDCPWLSPTPFRGKTNYPWRTKEVLEYSAELLNISFDELNEININNANLFYKKSIEKNIIKPNN